MFLKNPKTFQIFFFLIKIFILRQNSCHIFPQPQAGLYFEVCDLSFLIQVLLQEKKTFKYAQENTTYGFSAQVYNNTFFFLSLSFFSSENFLVWIFLFLMFSPYKIFKYKQRRVSITAHNKTKKRGELGKQNFIQIQTPPPDQESALQKFPSILERNKIMQVGRWEGRGQG